MTDPDDWTAGNAPRKTKISRLIGRTSAAAEQKLEQLESTEAFMFESYRVQTAITVRCENCEGEYELLTLLERRGCQCSNDEDLQYRDRDGLET